MELEELSKIAESATPGNWMWVNDRTPEHIRAGKFPYTHVTYTDDVVDEDSLYIATFDPPTVLALLSRLEQAERDLVAVRGSQKKLAKQLVATRSDQGKAEWRANNAEQAVERVRTLTNELSWSPNNVAIVQRYRDALDGHTKQLGGTPTGELADVCSCGKSYWPCTALDGDGRG